MCWSQRCEGVVISRAFRSARLECVYHRQQRRSEQKSPERKNKSEDERDENRCPDRYASHAPHDVWLKHQAIHYDDQRIKNENVERMLPVQPAKCSGEDWTEQTEDGPEVGNDL